MGAASHSRSLTRHAFKTWSLMASAGADPCKLPNLPPATPQGPPQSPTGPGVLHPAAGARGKVRYHTRVAGIAAGAVPSGIRQACRPGRVPFRSAPSRGSRGAGLRGSVLCGRTWRSRSGCLLP